MPGDAPVALTIGIPTYDDFQGVYFTIQALGLYHDLEDTELLVVDNFGCQHTKGFVEDWAKARYVLETDVVGTAAAKNAVFREARGEAVLCCDSHVLFAPGAIARLRAYHREHPDSRDLLQGPLVYDELQTIATHFAPEWRGQMWGVWATDPRGLDPEAEPFEIPMQGMGAFSCRREAWPGFNPLFRGFGGEEGYIQEKIRQRGGRCLCLPWLRWLHRFGRPAGVPYPLAVEDKLRNYVIGHLELGLELDPVLEHFLESLPEEQVESLAREALARHRSMPAARPAEPRAEPAVAATTPPTAVSRRAIVCFVEDSPHLVQQLLALRRSWLQTQATDTDLVAVGPADALARLPDDLVKIEQQPAADDPAWQGYRFINSIACLNGPGAERLDGYSHLLHTHADSFITPAWNRFYPDVFTWGAGHYANTAEIGRRLRAIAERYGFVHRGHTNVGASWYGPTDVVRRVAALTELLTKHLLTEHFALDPGEWPGWYRGVAVLYAAEIAVNHSVPFGRQSDLLDVSSTSTEPVEAYPHIHCHHTDERFSKHRFMSDPSDAQEAAGLELETVRDFCLAMSIRSLADLGEGDGARQDGRSPARVFREIHRSRLWGAESASGPGSTREGTALLREQLLTLFRELEIKTLCDAGCGTAEWIPLVSGGLDQYLGFDVVEELVLENVERHSGTKHFFQVADIARDVLPRADAILCRDALVHLPFDLSLAAIDNFRKSRSTYLIATTFPSVPENEEPRVGEWQPLNLTAPPFDFPPPVRSLGERQTTGEDPYSSKALGVWRLADLPAHARHSRPRRPRSASGAQPLVSCICPTYNRPPDYLHLVEEAIESFRRQTYSNKELILLNDCPGQQLVCAVPGVRVFNLPSRFASLGDKWNAAVELAAGELVAPWPDDDISLPWRLSLSVELIGKADYLNPRCYWALDQTGLQADHPLGYAHNASMFRRSAFFSAGGYPSISFGEDAALDATLSQRERVVDAHRGARRLERREWFFIYRWGVSPVHASSGQREGFYAEIGALPIVEGRFALSPHWRTDYVAATRAFEAQTAARGSLSGTSS